MALFLYLILQNPAPLITGTSAALAFILLVAGVLVTRYVYKTTLPTRLAETYKANFEAEKIRADQAEKERNDLRAQKLIWESERASLTLDYSQLSQLYARKSVILDAVIPIYTNLANIAETGRIEEFLLATNNPLVKRKEDDIHGTKDPLRTPRG